MRRDNQGGAADEVVTAEVLRFGRWTLGSAQRPSLGAGWGDVINAEDVTRRAIKKLTQQLQIVKGYIFDGVVEHALHRATARAAFLHNRKDADPAMLAQFFLGDQGFQMTVHNFHTSIW